MKKAAVIAAAVFMMAFMPAQEPKTYTLEFTADEVNTIYEALGELPAKKAEVIRFKLVQQVNAANQQSSEPLKKEKK
jgi:hypothetical protein